MVNYEAKMLPIFMISCFYGWLDVLHEYWQETDPGVLLSCVFDWNVISLIESTHACKQQDCLPFILNQKVGFDRA